MPQDLKALQRDLLRFKREMIAADRRAGDQTAKETVAYAKRLSSGPFSSATLAILDHPFAKRHGSVQMGLDPSVINRQSGIFQSDWKVFPIVMPSGETVFVVRNVAPYAEYLETGTKRMFARPMKVRLEFFAERTWERIAPPLFNQALLRTAFVR